MSILPQTFAFSERYVAKGRRIKNLLSAAIGILILFGVLITVAFDMLESAVFIVIFVIGAIPIWLLYTIQTRYTHSQWRQMRLHFGPNGLAHETGTMRQTVPWDSITKVSFQYTSRGEPCAIKVLTANSSPLLLFGFEPMSEVARIIKDGIPSTAQVGIKRQWPNWVNLVVMVSIILMTALVFKALDRTFGQEYISNIIAIFYGIYYLYYHPLSRTNPGLRRWEIGSGMLIMAIGIIMLITKVIE